MPDSPQPAVTLTRVSRLYGSFVALRDLTLTLPAGASVVLLGENGAGKSTLLKLLAGLARPSYGTLHVFGEPPAQAHGRIATLGHASLLYDELTALENLTYFATLHNVTNPAASAAQALHQVALHPYANPANKRRVGEFSQGMKQRASLARTLLTQPDLLLLDEPFSNLDVASVHSMIDHLLQYLAAPGTDGLPRTLILTTHQAELARPLARTTITLSEGRLHSIVQAEAAA